MDISMWVLWLILAVIFIVIEGITLGLTTIWCAIGSAVAAICAYFGAPIGIQIAVMVVVSIVFFFICVKWIKPQLNERYKRKENATNADRLFGEIGVVIKTIDTLEAQGQVKVKGQVWSAKTREENQVIPEGAKVKVLAIEGVKLLVEDYKEE
ncbi:MAG: NfeD family protein [Clostridiales bacterium]|nr:NfeD family protein [Clostridiales bacterium]